MKSGALTKETAAALYVASPDGDARQFLDYLIDHPGEQHWSETLQRELGFAEHKQVALAAWTVGEEASRLGLKRPWIEAQRGYIMNDADSALLAAARASHQ